MSGATGTRFENVWTSLSHLTLKFAAQRLKVPIRELAEEVIARETVKRIVEPGNVGLLMEAARRIDEWQFLSKRIPSTKLVPILVDQTAIEKMDSLTPKVQDLIRKVDGHRSIEEIATELNLSPFDVCTVLYGLITVGLVQLQTEPTHGRSHQLEHILTRLPSYSGENLGADIAEFAHSEVTEEDPLSARRIIPEDIHGVGAAFGHRLERRSS